MLRTSRASLFVALLWTIAVAAYTQVPGFAAPQTTPAPEQLQDPFDRQTPRGTITGFSLAAHRQDFETAAMYLQMTTAQALKAQALARDLSGLLDRYFNDPIASLSFSPLGRLDDSLPADRERLVLAIEGKPVNILLVRVKDPQFGPVWLVSSASLAEVPALHEAGGSTWLERHLPQSLTQRTWLGIPLARVVVWAATLLIPLMVMRFVSAAAMAFTRRKSNDPTRRALLQSWYVGLRWPIIFVLTLTLHLAVMPLLGFSLRFRLAYTRISLTVGAFAIAILLWRLLTLGFKHADVVAMRRGQSGLRSLLRLSERLAKVFVTMVAIFAVLSIAGVDTTTALAGVGLGGVAVALGAQKTVENLLGGVFLLTDGALAVGDECTISGRKGVVEDVTLRSVRLRTDEQTLLSVPAGLLSQSSVENFVTRRKILVQTRLRLQYGTTVDQLTTILARIRALLDERPDIETPTSRIRLVDFGERAIEVELFAYILTANALKFFAAREDLLLQVASIVEASGSGFAQPTQFIYQERLPDVERLEAHAK